MCSWQLGKWSICQVGNLANGPFAKLPTAHFSE